MSNIFENITDGLISFDDELIMEAVNADTLPENKTILKQVLLPQGNPVGRGELCFLYSHNIQDSLEYMKQTSNFTDRNHRYKFYYYNLYYQGKLNNKVYRFYDTEERKEYYSEIIDDKELSIIPRKRLTTNEKENKNMYYDLFRYIDIFENICGKLQPLRYITFYWAFFKSIYNIEIPGYSNKFVLVDLKKQPTITKGIKDNLKNPLFLIYYTLLRNKDLISDLDLDFYFYNDKKVIKINPSKCDDKSIRLIRSEMKKVVKGIISETELDDITDEFNIKKEEIIEDSASKVINKVDKSLPEDIIINSKDKLQKASAVSAIEKEVKNKVKEKIDNLSKEMIDDANSSKSTHEEITNEINSSVRKEIESDKELIEKIYLDNKRQNISNKSSISTARDEFLREEQKNLKVGNMTIADIEKQDVNKIKIPVTDISRNLNTTNENVKQIRFGNFDKTYNEKVMPKDITNAFLALNDKSIPMFIRNIEVADSSDELNYKDTYTIYLEDANRKRHTIKVDIPKFVDDKFLYIAGNKKIIKHQNFFYPVVKISPEMVQIVTNYSKMSIERVENKSISSVERLKKLIMTNEELLKYFEIGSSFIANKGYLTTIEYDDLSRVFTEFKKDNKTFFFLDQEKAHDYMIKNNIPEKKGYIFIGKENNENVYININTHEDDSNNSITELIVRNLPEEFITKFESSKSPKRLMYSKVKIMKQNVNVGMLLGFWEGISKLLEKLKTEYRLENSVPNNLKANEEFIKFNDCVLIYKADMVNSLILNGIRTYDTSKYALVDFDSPIPYLDYIKKVYGSTIIENALMNFYEFAVDPITKEICNTLNYPDDIVGLFIYAVNLLADSQFENDISQNLCRVRCGEIIPAILYERLSKNYVTYRNFAGRKKFTIPQDCVIKEILAQKTVEDYSTLNPTLEMEMNHAISSKGFRGVNLDRAYTMEKRGYDPSMTGIISPSTSPDGQVGVSKTLSLEPKITNIRGFTEDFVGEGKIDELKDVNLFSPGELSIPLGATIDDATRLG